MWEWRWPITDIKNEIREAEEKGATSTSFVNLRNLLDQLTDTYTRLEKEDAEKADDSAEYSQQMAHFERFIRHLYERASHYNTVIIAASYVAFLTVWSGIEKHVDSGLYVKSVVLTLISLTIFVLWEVGLNIYMARHIRNEANLFSKSGKEYLKEKEAQEAAVRKKKISVIPIWYLVLLVTVGCGLGGALLLIIGVFIGPTLSGA